MYSLTAYEFKGANQSIWLGQNHCEYIVYAEI